MSNSKTSSFARNSFDSALKAALPIAFNAAWANGTGYFDGAVAEEIEAGEVRQCKDNLGRQLVLIGTPVGTCVVFERYSDNKEKLVCNLPVVVEKLIAAGNQCDDRTALMLFNYGTNIGQTLNCLVQTADSKAIA